MITIFTDGSSRGNPGPGGWGSVIVTDSDNTSSVSRVIELGGFEQTSTNNRMEIMAAIRGLQKVSQDFSTDSDIVIHTDSAYLINGITKWVKGWQAKGWITLQREPVVNKDLWEMLVAETKGKKISWKKVGGHVGTAGNERCDEIATLFADGKDADLFTGSYADYPIKNILEITVDEAAAEKRSKSKERSNAKAYSYISSVDGIIQTHKTWAECGARVKGKSGTRFKKSISPFDEKAIIAEFKGN